MSALRLARGYTGRDYIVKIEGHYHGHADGLLVKAGSGLTTLGTPTSPGVPIFDAHGPKIACVIVEGVPGNMGLVLPADGYVQGLRELTRKHGALLIVDEVMSGYRAAMGGACERYDVTPDLVTLGKVMGGGLPVGAYGGPAQIMDKLSPVGPVYQAGTLSGNPLATAAGIKTLELLERPGVFAAIENSMKTLCDGFGAIAKDTGIPICLAQVGSMAGFFFHEGPVRNYAEATASDTKRYAKFFHGMLDRGVYFAPSQFEAFFMSSAHTAGHIDQTLCAAREVFGAL
jgi:glutamate-1-semialdehyde 2,1-aminomutase